MLLLHGDCLEVMTTLPDRSVDLFICDLPYGCLATRGDTKVSREYRGGKSSETNATACPWDIKLDLTQFWVHVKRIARDDHTPVLMFCTTKFGVELINSNPDWFRYDLVWNKLRGVGFLNANKAPMRSHEMIYVFAKKGATYYRTDVKGEFERSHTRGNAVVGTMNTYNGGRPLPLVPQPDNSTTRCVLSIVDSSGYATRKKGQHPTQKPDDLYEWLITRYSKEGDTVLDPTAGSFASVFTAERLGRNGIGIEKDDAFYAKAVSQRE